LLADAPHANKYLRDVTVQTATGTQNIQQSS